MRATRRASGDGRGGGGMYRGLHCTAPHLAGEVHQRPQILNRLHRQPRERGVRRRRQRAVLQPRFEQPSLRQLLHRRRVRALRA
jgi:hypothetical protein